MTITLWRDVRGYKGIYQVSNDGRVRSVDRLDSVGARRTGKLVKIGSAPDGRPIVHLTRDGKHTTRVLRVVVAEAFDPEHARNLSYKLTDVQVQQIRAHVTDGMPVGKVAAAFGISHSHVWALAVRMKWRHLP